MSTLTALSAFLFAGCPATEAPPPKPPSPCDVLVASGGAAGGALASAQAHLDAARATGDEGEYTLADAALQCHLSLHPDDESARALAVYLLVQEHEFAEAEAAGRVLVEANPRNGQAWAFLGDARMERGDNDLAAEAYQHAVDLRPGVLLYDRIGWLRWLEGDLPGAVEMAELAVSNGTAADRDTYSWVLTRLGWLHALQGQPSPELSAALAGNSTYTPARFAQSRVVLYQRNGPIDPLARLDALRELAEMPTSIEAWRLRAEFPTDPNPNPSPPLGDRRGLADYLATREPERALKLAEEELTVRHDAVTRMTHAWAAFHAKKPGFEAEARAALATGCIEPRLLHHGAVILRDPELARRALAMGVGLLPSERAELEGMGASGGR